MRGIRSRREAYLEQLIQEIEALKAKVDEKHELYLALSDGVEAFAARYTQYVEGLDRQRVELENEIQRCRFQLRHPNGVDDQDVKPDLLKEDYSEEDNADHSSQEAEPVLGGSDLSPGAVDDDKSLIHKYFAHFWHPDRDPEHGNDLMLALNSAYSDSEDAVDMVIIIPWHKAWRKSTTNESWQDRLGRLTDWKLYLEEGLERVAQRLTQLQQDWRYARYQEWEEADRSSDYFVELADEERREILRLEHTLETLRKQLAGVQQNPSSGETKDA
jgi:hypothetical protein